MSTSQHSVYDYAKDFWVPTTLGLGTIVSALWGKVGVLVLGLALATTVALVVVWIRMRKRARTEVHSREQQHVAALYYPRFRKLVGQFGDFVDTRTSDTLHYMVTNDFPLPTRDDLCKRLGTAPLGLWNQFWFFFKQRIDRTAPTFTELLAGIQEFHHLLGEYNNLCVAPIFSHLPNDTRASLTEQQRSKLNGFQQRFTIYLRDYMEFAKELSSALPELDHMPRYLPHSNPL